MPLHPPKMKRPRRHNTIAIALYCNAAVLLLLVVVLLSRTGSAGMAPAALAQSMESLAAAEGVYAIPAQLAANQWGCYIIDTNTQTICVYQYHPADRMLRLMAARQFTHDRRLRNFNTQPSPQEIAELVNRQDQPVRPRPADPEPASPQHHEPQQQEEY